MSSILDLYQGGNYMEFKVKEEREKKLMSQEDLSIASGISRSIISGLESGKPVATTTSTLKSLAKALNCRVSDIFLPESSSILDEISKKIK